MKAQKTLSSTNLPTKFLSQALDYQISLIRKRASVKGRYGAPVFRRNGGKRAKNEQIEGLIVPKLPLNSFF